MRYGPSTSSQYTDMSARSSILAKEATPTIRALVNELECLSLRAENAGLCEVQASRGYPETLIRHQDQITLIGRRVEASITQAIEIRAAFAPVTRTHEETLLRTVQYLDNHNVSPSEFFSRLHLFKVLIT